MGGSAFVFGCTACSFIFLALCVVFVALGAADEFGGVEIALTVVFGLFGSCCCCAVFGMRSYFSKTGVKRSVCRSGPLAGIKVLDLSVVIAGPWSTALLGELGAEVIRVESHTLIDSARALGHSPAKGMAGCLASTGRGKQSIVLNLKKPEAIEAVKRIVAKVDVLIQNYRPGAAERMGIGYEDMIKINPKLIYISSSGFGATGPSSMQRIYDPVIQSRAGVGEIQKKADGSLHLVSSAFCDKTSALVSFQAITAGLLARKNGVGGQHIQAAMLDNALYYLWPDLYMNYTFRKPEKDDKRSPDGGAKDADMKEFDEIEISKFIDKIPGMDKADKDREQIRKVDELVKDEAFTSKYFISNPPKHLICGAHHMPPFPVKFTANKLEPRQVCPFLGENTVKILHDLEYSDKEIEEMIKSGAAVSTKSLLMFAHSKAPKAGLDKKAKAFGYVEDFQKMSENTFKPVRFLAEKQPGDSERMQTPLGGVNVLEFCNLAAGPLTSLILADQGANVTKVELENKLDPSRTIGPQATDNMGALYCNLNRNKESVIVNEQDCASQIADLLTSADVVIVDKDMESTFGLSLGTVRARNPKATYVVIDKAGGEYKVQANSGLAGDQLDSDEKCQWIEGLHVEKATSFYIAGSITAALYRGDPEFLEIDMMRIGVHFALPDIFWGNVWEAPNELAEFPNLDRIFKIKQLADCSVFTGALSDREWEGVLKVWGHGKGEGKERIESGKWSDPMGRLVDVDLMWGWINDLLGEPTFEKFAADAKEADILCSKVLTQDQVIADEQVNHNKILQTMDFPKIGEHRFPRYPVKFEKTPCVTEYTAAPMPGEVKVVAETREDRSASAV